MHETMMLALEIIHRDLAGDAATLGLAEPIEIAADLRELIRKHHPAEMKRPMLPLDAENISTALLDLDLRLTHIGSQVAHAQGLTAHGRLLRLVADGLLAWMDQQYACARQTPLDRAQAAFVELSLSEREDFKIWAQTMPGRDAR